MLFKKLVTSGLLIGSLLATQVMSFGAEMLGQTNFNDGVGLPWHTCETMPAKTTFKIENGKYYVTVVNTGAPAQRWDAQFRHRNITIRNGWTYTVKFTVKADKAAEIYPKVGDQKDPYFEDWNYNNRSFQPIKLQAGVATTITETFTGKHDADVGEFAFHIGGSGVPAGTTFEFDDISLNCTQWNPTPVPPTAPPKGIRVNQLGYYPSLKKEATLLSTSTSPVDWALKNSSGTTVASGKSIVMGLDKDSGDNVHIIDFSTCTTVGKGYKLVAGTAESWPFDIDKDIYSALKYDALKYFYHSRSGVAIDGKYTVPANGAANHPKWARKAGHSPDLVPTEKADGQNPMWRYDQSYTLDITGGWYDAGDHGKYVVNGGISTWTMMNEYERAKIAGTDAAMGDGKMNIPESGNGFPDLLDEARFNMATLLKMQVKTGPLKDMVHHKGHDETWTGLGIAPHEDTKPRILKPPTTAASLNLAAIGAQSSRLWKTLDPTFAATCLDAAERAYVAAKANPKIYAPFDEAVGGGPYGDNYVIDDFYWAACELYITTGKASYLDEIKASPHYLEMPKKLTGGEALGVTGCFDWGNTQGLGTISLWLNKPAGVDIATIETNIKASADNFLSIMKVQGYGSSIDQGPVEAEKDSSGKPIPGKYLIGYPWGSNSFIMNSGIVMAYAFEISGDAKYLSGTAGVMDYIMGRNPNVISYVTGYGENALAHPHHRYFADQTDPNYPPPPPGIVSGGPNSGLQDPWVKGSGWKPYGYAPQKCFMDHIESWSTNECTINWNTPLAWLAAFMDEKATTIIVSGANVTGTVSPDLSFSNDEVKAGFTVTVGDKSATTDSTGSFAVKNVKAGSYSVTISKPGYLTRTIANVTVPSTGEVVIPATSTSMWAGDMTATKDGAINMADIMEVAKGFNSIKGDSRYVAESDLNMDGAINMADIMAVAKHFNASSY